MVYKPEQEPEATLEERYGAEARHLQQVAYREFASFLLQPDDSVAAAVKRIAVYRMLSYEYILSYLASRG